MCTKWSVIYESSPRINSNYVLIHDLLKLLFGLVTLDILFQVFRIFKRKSGNMIVFETNGRGIS